MVEMTFSLAMKPVSTAVAARQSPKPSGSKMGANIAPIPASMLCDWSATTLKRTSKVCRNQMMSVAMNTTVNAFFANSFALSQASRHTVPRLGSR